jgi:hypothetical protein
MTFARLKRGQDIASRHQDRVTDYLGVKGYSEHERRLFAISVAQGTVSTDGVEPVFVVTEIVPTPRILNRRLDAVVERVGRGHQAVRVQTYEIQDVSREFIDGRLRPNFWLVLAPFELGPGILPQSADVVRRNGEGNYIYTRFELLGTPEPYETAYRITLVEKR